MSASQSLRRPLPWLVAFLLAGPLVVLPVQAFADEWRSPAVAPQRWGWRGWEAVWNDPLVPRAVGNSMLVALATVAIATPVAWFACRAVSHAMISPRVRTGLLVGLLLPLLLPPLAVGEGLRAAFLSSGLGFSLFGIVLSHLVYVVPYTLIVLLPAFTADLRETEEAARGLGSGALWRFRLVTLPAVLPNLLTSTALGFVVSWSQYGTTLGVGGGIPTLPIVLLPFVRSDPQVSAALSLIFVAPAMLAIALSLRSRR